MQNDWGAPAQVRIGSMSDPEELPGLAHFVEHMLFYSSEKYPEVRIFSSIYHLAWAYKPNCTSLIIWPGIGSPFARATLTVVSRDVTD